MKLKALTQSKGERNVKTILEDRLANTRFQVSKEVRLGSVIGREPTEERLSAELFDYLTRAGLDFLIFYRDPPHLPFLAVEFDGPHHDTDSKARKRDLLKNRLCQLAGLPLLRVRYPEIEPLFTRDSFLSYIVEVILRYKTTDERKGYSPYDEIRRHDLGDVQRLRDQLAKNHRMIPSDRAAETPTARFAYEFGPPGHTSSETDSKYKSELVVRRVNRFLTPKQWPVAHRISKELALRTHYRTTAEPRPPDSSDLEAYVKWLEKKPLYHPDLPGVRWLYVAWNILEGLCLKQLLLDAEGYKP
jgi:Protein of unknown function (DUF2726)